MYTPGALLAERDCGSHGRRRPRETDVEFSQSPVNFTSTEELFTGNPRRHHGETARNSHAADEPFHKGGTHDKSRLRQFGRSYKAFSPPGSGQFSFLSSLFGHRPHHLRISLLFLL
ncbi:hypothetical protein PGTUg99_011951 [Puccinia graminis f. sp. tritici]|uniref:Uncharacterized protein n=1 Tax=Puccinia graminis f. sp. tritici TaxID=56615 RepID=A0A5B0R4W9_PUCGR|nr:hypothetical protein PGTUg99_011951 [Puccinia graminis f. sp. tritici]